MKSIGISNTCEEEKKKMTLRSYFFSIPAVEVAPRNELIKRIANKCNVPYSTARSWLAYGTKPRNEEFIKILAEETGLNPSFMWDK